MTCMILEDEKAAQEILQTYIAKTPFLSCIGIYESGLDIPQKVLEEADVLFLDIHLPEINGMSFLKTLQHPPQVIVTSAYSTYAIEAFEQATVDYLVKPFPYERFFKAVSRIQKQLNTSTPEPGTVLLYADKTTYRVELQDILYLEAKVDYVNVVTAHQEILLLDSLQHWESKLAHLSFARIHRSFIVNLKSIQKASGSQVFIADKNLPIGRTYKDRFVAAWKSSV